MKFGVREICEVVLKAKATQKVGNKVFYKNEPVIYFDTLKTSSMEGAATTVYAQGGRGNSRLVAWEGERTVTFTMEDALISPAGFMILSGAGLIQGGKGRKSIKVHTTTQTDEVYASGEGEVFVVIPEKPYIGNDLGSHEDLIYVMRMENDEVVSEPFIPKHAINPVMWDDAAGAWVAVEVNEETGEPEDGSVIEGYRLDLNKGDGEARPGRTAPYDDLQDFNTHDVVLVDYYVERGEEAQQIDITPDKFGGNYYLEASTLFRTTDGVDMPAEFIIPNCKIQSNFTFTMASTGDPSTFTFTMDAFPDYTRFDRTKKVLAAIQIVNTGNASDIAVRTRTPHDEADEKFLI